MNRLSQVPLGSNPATAKAIGADNMPLNNEAGSDVSGVTPKQLKKSLDNIAANANDKQKHDQLINEVGNLTMNIKDPNIKKNLNTLGNALQNTKDPRKSTRDPETGKKDPSAVEIANNISKKIQPMIQEASKVYNHRLAQKEMQKPKKKTRGNPFRVLMGKVGKLLDHGVEKKDIVRYLAKLKYWNNETIERAVDIVKDYNKKKKRDSDKEDKTAFINSNVKIAALDYDREPDFKKRSTGELIARACFLVDLMEQTRNTKQGDFKDPADKTGAKEELKSIRAALEDRGLDKEELSNLGLGN